MSARTAEPSGAPPAEAVTPAQYLEVARRLTVQTATRAPSVHNSQPWRFTHDPDGLDLYADDPRRLAVLDPTGRQVHLSCGAPCSTPASPPEHSVSTAPSTCCRTPATPATWRGCG